MSTVSEVDVLRSQVAELSRELAARDQTLQEHSRHLDNEFQDLRKQSTQLQAIVTGTAEETGESYFTALVTHLTSALGVQYAVIGEVRQDSGTKKIRTMAVAAGGALVDNFEYDLLHTPCETALASSFACFERGVQAAFPSFTRLGQLQVEGYCGLSLRAKNGAVIGLLVIMDVKPICDREWLRSLLTIFASRATAELERARAEQERSQALADLHNVMETIPDVLFTLGLQGHLVRWNQTMERVTGYSAKELLNKHALEFVPPAEHESTASAIQRAFQDGYAELEGHLLTKDGRMIPYHWTGARLSNQDGHVIGLTGVGRDITGRKAMERQRQEQTERLRLAMDIADLATWDWDISTNHVAWSENCEQVKRLPPGTFDGTFEAYQQLVHPDDLPTLFANINRALAGPDPYHTEHRIVPPGGDVQWIEGNGIVYRNENGQPIRMVGTVRNTTARRRAEEALRISEERFALAVEGSTDVLWDAHRIPGKPWHAPETPIWWSPRTRQLLDLEDGESFDTLMQWTARLHPDDTNHVFTRLTMHIEQRVPYDVEYRLRTNHGEYRWVRGRGQAIWNNQGEICRMSGSCQDITERKQAEEALRVSEERFTTAFNEAAIGMALVAPDGQWLEVNQALCQMLGYAQEELQHTTFQTLTHPDDLPQSLVLQKRMLSGELRTQQIEKRYLHKAGHTVWAILNVSSVCNHEGHVLYQIAQIQDITDRKRAEQLLEAENQVLAMMASSRSLPDTLTVLCECCESLGHGMLASVLLLDQDGQHLQHSASPSLPESYNSTIDGVAIGPDVGSCGTAAYLGRQVIVTDIATDPLWEKYRECALSHGLRACWSNPIISDDGQVLGTFALYYRMPREPVPADLHLIDRMTNLTRFAIERKRSEQALKTSEEKLRQALLASNTGLWDWNTETGEVSFSKEWKSQLGFSEGELPDTFECWESRLHPDDRARAVAYAQQYRDNPIGAFRQDFRLRHKDGTYRWIDSHASFVTEPDGRRVRMLGSHTDITERKRAETELRTTTQLIEDLIRTSPLAIIRLSEDGERVEIWNHAAETLLGWRADEVLGKPIPWIPPDKKESAHAIWTAVVTTGQVQQVEVQRLRKDGTLVDLSLWCSSVHNDRGGAHSIGFVADITARKQMEAELAEREERLRLFIEHSPVALAMLDHEMRYVAVSHRWRTDYRVGDGPLIGRSHYEVFPEIPDRWKAIHQRCLAGAVEGCEEDPFIRTDGRTDWSRWEIRPWLMSDGSVGGIIIFSEDITARKQAEDDRKLFRALLDQVTDSIEVIDPTTGRFLDGNRQAYESIGYTRSEWLALTVPEIDPLVTQPAFQEYMRNLRETNVPLCIESLHRRKDGTTFPVEVSAQLLHHDRDYLVTIVRDITKRKELEAVRVRQYEALQAIFNMTVALSRASTLEEIYEQGINGVQGALKVDRASILLFDDDGVMKFKASRGLSKEYIQAVEGHSPWSREAVNPTPIGMEDIEEDPSAEAYREAFRAEHIRALGFIPLWSSDGLLGKFMLYYDSPHPFADEEIQVAQTIAGHIAFMIQRKRAEEALRINEERYARATAIGKVGVWQLDVASGQYHGDANLKALFGYGPGELSTDPFAWLGLVHPDDQPIALNTWEQIVSGATDEYHYELRMIRKDGSIIWTHVRGHANRDETGSVIRLIGATVDITERKGAEEALRLSEEQFRAVFESAAVGIAVGSHTTGTGIDQVNPVFAAMLGYTPEELYQLGMKGITFPDDLSASKEFVSQLIKGIRSHGTIEKRYVKKDGSLVWALTTVSSVLDKQGNYLKSIALIQDITERKRVEAALHASEERYRTLYDDTPTMYFTLAMDGTVRSVNRFGAEQLGYRVEELVGHSVLQVFHEDDKEAVASSLSECLQAPEMTQHVEFQKVRKDKTVIWVRETVRVGQSSNGEAVVLVACEDVTERKKAEEALAQSEQAIRALHEATAESGLSFDERIQKVLEVGCRRFNLSIGMLTQVVGNQLELVQVWAPGTDFRVGMAVPLEKTYCNTTLHETQPVCFEHAGASDWQYHPGYKALGLESYIGTKLIGRDQVYGTVCFTSQNPLPTVFSQADKDFVQLMARWISGEMDRRVAEQALKRSEERYRTLYDDTPTMYFTLAADGTVCSVNRYGAEQLGYRVEELVGHSVLDIFHEGDKETVARSLAECLATPETTKHWEFRKVRKDGAIIWVRETVRVGQSSTEETLVLVTCEDITERRRMEEALRKSEQYNRVLFENSPIGLVLCGLDGTIMDCNEQYGDILGRARSEVLGKTYWELTSKQYDEQAQAVMGTICRTGRFGPYEKEYVHAKGHFVPVRLFGTLIEEDGELFMVCSVEDITERKRVEVELQNSHAFMRQVIDTDPNFIFAKDRDGRFMLVNKATADVYGTTVDGLIGKTDADFNSRHEEVTQFRLKDLEVMDTLQDRFIPEEKITDAAGKIRWLQTVKRPLLDAQGYAVMLLGASTDITARKRVEEMLRQRERDLRAAVEERERISEDLHDGILQSIFAVGLGLESCRTLVSKPPRKKAATPLMAALNRAIGQLNHVMADVRNFIAGIESHVLEEADIGETLRTMVQAMCASNGTACRVMIEEAAVREFSTEQAYHVMNVLREALSNSLRHSGAVRITLSLKRLRHSVRLSVTDNGKGFIPEAVRDVGHGLINMAARARKLGGRIEVRSRPRQGTKVLLDIPRRLAGE